MIKARPIYEGGLKMEQEKGYNGWKNRATWNVALWLSNSEGLYKAAVGFMQGYRGKHPYYHFIKEMGMRDERTGDNFKWLSNRLDYEGLNEMMRELA